MVSRSHLAGGPLVVAWALALAVGAPRQARAQEAEGHGEIAHPEHDEGPRYVLGIGGTLAVDLGAQHVNGGGGAFFEFEAIERWLTVEAGVTWVKTAGGSELSSDILFKKPFELSRHVELLIGLGPEAVQTIGTTPSATYFGLEGVLNFMFWPTTRVGVFVTPAYDVVFKPTTKDSFGPTANFGVTVGPMLTWR